MDDVVFAAATVRSRRRTQVSKNEVQTLSVSNSNSDQQMSEQEIKEIQQQISEYESQCDRINSISQLCRTRLDFLESGSNYYAELRELHKQIHGNLILLVRDKSLCEFPQKRK